ncbi:MAG: DUF4199 domain-containing protein [Parvularculaceae bacterium]
MLKIAGVYGAIAGSIVISVMIAGLVMSGGEGPSSSAVFGYLVMIVALTLIFLGIKKHRDQNLGGVIKFGPAFILGLMIAGIAGLFYVIGWEGYTTLAHYDFAGDYANAMVEKAKAAGAEGEALQKAIDDAEAFRKSYADPLYRLPMTFIEIFPVGLVVALVSALVLRNPKAFPARG